MSAFKGAVDVGAHAIETDLHLSKDGVVVLSHVRFLTFRRNGRKPGQSLLNIGCYSQTLFWKG
jgi:glycerophosphoryl diester phosphodiesterase